MRASILVFVWCLSACWGCGGDDDDGASAGSSGGAGTSGGAATGATGAGKSQAKTSCYAQCDAQDNIPDCDPIVSNQECKLLCDQLVSGTPDDCLDEFSAFYDCTVMDGFGCTIGLPSSKTDQCDDEQDTLDECVNGPGGTKCEGQDENGRCPQVACPCPEGTKMVSGVDLEGSGCKCLDAVTCRDLFCD